MPRGDDPRMRKPRRSAGEMALHPLLGRFRGVLRSRDELEWTNRASDSDHAAIIRELSQWLPESDASDSEIVEYPVGADDYKRRIEAMM